MKLTKPARPVEGLDKCQWSKDGRMFCLTKPARLVGSLDGAMLDLKDTTKPARPVEGLDLQTIDLTKPARLV